MFFDRIVVTTGCDFLQKAFWRRWGGGNLVEAGWKPALPGKVRFIQCLTLSALLLNLSANIAARMAAAVADLGMAGVEWRAASAAGLGMADLPVVVVSVAAWECMAAMCWRRSRTGIIGIRAWAIGARGLAPSTGIPGIAAGQDGGIWAVALVRLRLLRWFSIQQIWFCRSI